ncbi:MAG: type IX secretion system membrane protein PorP/SprF [Bacteroidota bacterium]
MKLLLFNIRSLIILSGIFFSAVLSAQNIPSGPLSIPVYHPMVLNPAYVGSKDFTNISFTTRALKNWDHQMIHAHKRLTSPDGYFSNFGLGGYTFLEQVDQSWNTGMAIAGSYHYSLDEARLHNISGGLSLKGILGIPEKTDESPGDSVSATFNPDMDFGVYYYGPSAFGGLSVTSAFGSSRHYHLYGGYKFLLSRSQSIVLEPSLLVSLNDSTFSEAHKQITPYLKLYLQNFYIGTYMKSLDLFALFFQYQFPRFYTGVFLEFPRKGFLNDDNIIFELSLGINLGRENRKFLQHRHW